MPVSISGAGVVSGIDLNPNMGLAHIITQNFSAVSSISINNCFSANYKNYSVVIDTVATPTSSVQLTMRLRSNGTDYSGSTYYWGEQYVTHAAGPSRGYGSATSSWAIGYSGNSARSSCIITILNPYNAVASTFHSQYTTQSGSLNVHGMSSGGGDISQYDGISTFLASGTMTGSISVYGYEVS